MSVTTLDGLIISVDPSDPAECFDKTVESYVGEEMITVEIDGQTHVLHLCGDTNTGMNYRGCHHGALFGDDGTESNELNCRYVRTGETAIAQACVFDCGYVIDATFKPLVLVAEIDGQWYIVNVLTGSEISDPTRRPCPTGLCCDIGRNDLVVTLSGCDVVNGQTMTLEAKNVSGLAWEGYKDFGSVELTITVACNDLTGSWSMSLTCNDNLGSGSLSFEFDCGSGTGSNSGGFGGTFEWTGVSNCGGCTQINGSISIGDTSAVEACRQYSRTNEKVIARACGLPFLEVGDFVIAALVPKSGTGTDNECGGTEGGTSDDQWEIVLACSSAVECEPCPPPPPPPESECCDLSPDEIPSTLIGTMHVSSNINECDCIDDISVSFSLVPGSVPAEWVMDNEPVTCDGQPGSGSMGGAVLSGLSGMSVRCGGESTGSDGSGTGADAKFYLGYPGCAEQGQGEVESSAAACDPVYMEFTMEIPSCCGPVSGVDVRVTIELELMGVI